MLKMSLKKVVNLGMWIAMLSFLCAAINERAKILDSNVLFYVMFISLFISFVSAFLGRKSELDTEDRIKVF